MRWSSPMVLTATLLMFALAFLLASLLMIADHWLFVPEDPRVAAVERLLPHTNCGACGYPGCHAFAEALVDGQAVPAGCTVSTAADHARIAACLGVEVGRRIRRVARLACAGGHNVASLRAHYEGPRTCADPDDEEKLVHRLQSWVAGDRKRRVHIVFDNGEFGGISPQLSGLRVKTQYARLGRTADDELIRHLKQLKNPQEYTLITSDREILDVAQKRRVGYILSEEFVTLMTLDAAERLAPEAVPPEIEHDPGTRPEVEVSTDEVEAWLQVFDKPIPSTRTPKPTATSQTSAQPKRPRSPQEMKADGRISEDDLAEWLDLFGKTPPSRPPAEEPTPPLPEPKSRPAPAPQRKKSPPSPSRPASQQKYTTDKLDADEVNEWLDIFTKPDKK